MDQIMTTKRGGGPAPDSPEAIAAREKAAERKARHERSKRIAEKRKAAAVPVVLPERSDVATDIAVPTPPFWGSRIVKGISLSEYSGAARRARSFPRPVGAFAVSARAMVRRTRNWSSRKAVRDFGTGSIG